MYTIYQIPYHLLIARDEKKQRSGLLRFLGRLGCSKASQRLLGNLAAYGLWPGL